MANLHIGITGDGSSAISELARVQAAIDKLSGKTIRIRVDVDGTGKAVADMQGLTKATDDLTRASRAQSRASRSAARATVEHGIACLTSLDTAWEVLGVLSFMRERRLVYSLALQDYVGGGDDLA